MKDKVFIDTNILVYSRDLGAGEKHKQAAGLMESCWESRNGVLSVQVLNEYFVTVTRKLKPGLSPEIAWKDVSLLKAWQLVPGDWILVERSYEVFRERSLSWWDAQIVAAAQLADCRLLYSEDLNDGEKIGNLEVQNPFK